LIGATAQSTWDGFNNSLAIVSQSGHSSSAAALCLNSTNGGLNDWYLPSRQELHLIYTNMFQINKTLSQITGATLPNQPNGGPGYWCSTEYTANGACVYYLQNGSASFPVSKSSPTFVRAIRSF
jgi:hypothetical protein